MSTILNLDARRRKRLFHSLRRFHRGRQAIGLPPASERAEASFQDFCGQPGGNMSEVTVANKRATGAHRKYFRFLGESCYFFPLVAIALLFSPTNNSGLA